MKLRPITKNAIWGGTFLAEKFNKPINCGNTAESWELSVRDAANVSIIENGSLSGHPISDYLNASNFKGNFPLLIKYLDAAADLSVQVHPDDSYAAKHGEVGKTEIWYILRAEDGAKIVYGIKDSVSISEFQKLARENRTADALNYVNVKAGEVYFIPPGLVHALGAGITVAEVQTNCNTTYRLYDYDRRQSDGTLRELHVDDALAVVRKYTEKEISDLRLKYGTDFACDEVIASSDHFSVFLHRFPKSLAVNHKSDFTVLMCVGGEGVISASGDSYGYSAGDTYLVPAECGNFTVSGGTLLEIHP